jgi:hypothetical protein
MNPSCFRLRRSGTPARDAARALGLALVAAGSLLAAPLAAQDADPGPFRIGVNLAGTSLVAFVVEHRWGSRAAELSVGTISFRDVSFSLVGKQYFSGGSLRPFAGVGLWSVVAWEGERTGSALIARAPLGLHWNFTGDHAAGAEMNLNRALAVRRTDPDDDTPPNTAVVPIPALYYRFHLR